MNKVRSKVEKGYDEFLLEDLNKGLDPNTLYDGKRSLFQHAIIHGQLKTASLLLENGVQINGKNQDGRKSLMFLALVGLRKPIHQRTWDFLIVSGADINYQGLLPKSWSTPKYTPEHLYIII
jgi:ankyrin repeat protein